MLDKLEPHKDTVGSWLWWGGALAAVAMLARRICSGFKKAWDWFCSPMTALRSLSESVAKLATAVQEFKEATGGQLTDIYKKIESLTDQARIGRAHTRLLYEDSSVGTFECGPNGECVWANTALAGLFGTETERMLGWGWLENIHPDDSDMVRDHWLHSLEHRLPYNRRYRIVTGGKTITVSAKAKFIVGEQGKILCSIGTVTPLEVTK